MFTRKRVASWFLAATLPLLTGCGGGGGSKPFVPAGLAPTRNGVLTRFDVDVKTGKVLVTPGVGEDRSSRAILTGGAVSFFSSDLLSAGGDSGKRLLHIRVVNNSNEAASGALRLVLSNLSNTLPVDGKANTLTTTLAGNGTASSTDGYGTGATLNAPVGITNGGSAAPNTFYVSDSAGNKIRKVYADGNVITFAGSGTAGSADGTGTSATFNSPQQLASDSAGNLFVADSASNKIRRITPGGHVTTIAGTGTAGATDGIGNVAMFNGPKGIGASSDGNRLYVADTGSNKIRLIAYTGSQRDSNTSYTVSTAAGTGTAGSADGDSMTATFNTPIRLALATDYASTELLFVADKGTHIIRRIEYPSFAAYTATIAGTAGTSGSADGPGSSATLSAPNGLAVVSPDSARFVVFVAEDTAGAGKGHLVREILYTGNEPRQAGSYQVVTLGGSAGTTGSADGDGSTARFNAPASLYTIPASGPAATLLIADTTNNRLRKMQVSSGALNTGFTSATSVTEAVRVVNWDREVPQQNGSTPAAAWSKTLSLAPDGPGYAADVQFYVPAGVSGFTFTAYVEADTSVVNLPAANAAYMSTLVGDGKNGTNNGPGNFAELYNPEGVVAAPPALQFSYSLSGVALPPVRAFVADSGNHRIRYVDANGSVGTFAGSVSGFADGTGTAAKFNGVRGVTVGADGALYVADTMNHRIRRISVSGVVSTIAGTGTAGSSNGTSGADATFNQPNGIAIDNGGALYLCDYVNNSIRKVSYISGSADQAASYVVVTIQTGLNGPIGIACDNDGKVYFAEGGNQVIRQLTRAGGDTMTMTTFAGVAGTSGSGDGALGTAKFTTPIGVAVDTAHNVYVTDSGNNRVCRISPLQVTKTILGNGSGFVDGYDSSPPASPLGKLNLPRHIAVEATGSLLVTDYTNHSLRVIQRVLRDSQTPTP